MEDVLTGAGYFSWVFTRSERPGILRACGKGIHCRLSGLLKLRGLDGYLFGHYYGWLSLRVSPGITILLSPSINVHEMVELVELRDS